MVMCAAKPTIAERRARSSTSCMLTARRCGGRRLPNCSTCSSSFTIRRLSPTMRSVSSRSSPVRFMPRSCAAPVMPASGFLISWASISAMPMAERAARRGTRARGRGARRCPAARPARARRPRAARDACRSADRGAGPDAQRPRRAACSGAAVAPDPGGAPPRPPSMLESVRQRGRGERLGRAVEEQPSAGPFAVDDPVVARRGRSAGIGSDCQTAGRVMPRLLRCGPSAAPSRRATRSGAAVSTARRRRGGRAGAVHVPAQMLARDAPAERGAVEVEHRRVMRGGELAPSAAPSGGTGAAPCPSAAAICGGQPGAPLRAAPDHHAGRPGGGQGRCAPTRRRRCRRWRGPGCRRPARSARSRPSRRVRGRTGSACGRGS